MLRLLSDENFSGDIVRGLMLRQPGLDLERVQDVGLEQADDPTILTWASTLFLLSPLVNARHAISSPMTTSTSGLREISW